MFLTETQTLSLSLSQAVEVHPAGDVPYACGGVGELDLKALEAQTPHDNMGFWVVEGPRGAYLAEVSIRILHQCKTVAVFTADGPLCAVKAPAGSYIKLRARTGSSNAASRCTPETKTPTCAGRRCLC